MEWAQSSSYLNPIENLLSTVKIKLYEGGKPYNSQVDLWETIKTTMPETEPVEVKKKK